MENLNNINWNERQKELLNSLNESTELFNRCSSVRIQYTRLHSICITVHGDKLYGERIFTFPYPSYRLFTAFKVQDFSAENLKNIVLSQIEN